MKKTMDTIVITVEQAAIILGVSERHVHNLCKKDLPYIKIRNEVRFDLEDVQTYKEKFQKKES